MHKRKQKTRPKPKVPESTGARRELGTYFGDIPPRQRRKSN